MKALCFITIFHPMGDSRYGLNGTPTVAQCIVAIQVCHTRAGFDRRLQFGVSVKSA